MENTKRILIVNDDGINSDGLKRLAIAAKKYGEVWVFAPSSQRSAASHSLTIDSPLDVYPADWNIDGIHAFSCSGLPTDCFRIGSKNIMPEKPDLVLSGINNGYNAGTDIQYSATVGAALDAAMCGYPVIAFSEGFLTDQRSTGENHAVTDAFLPVVLSAFLEDSSEEKKEIELRPGQVININFPDCPVSDCQGIKWNCKVSMNTPYIDNYVLSEELPGGGKRFEIRWVDRDHADEGTDVRALLDNYVSISIVNNIS